MPVGSQGTPISYVSPKTGKQYVVVTAVVHDSLQTMVIM